VGESEVANEAEFDMSFGQASRTARNALADGVLRHLCSELGCCAAVVDAKGHVFWTSVPFQQRFGAANEFEALLREHELETEQRACDRVETLLETGNRATHWVSLTIPEAPGVRLWLLNEHQHRVRLEGALQTAKGRLRLLSAHTQGIIFEFNSRGRFTHVWASDPHLLARPEHELIGRTVSEALGPELGMYHDTAIQKALQTGTGAEYEYPMDVPGGRLWFMATSVVVPDTNGEDRAVIYWIRDVTQRVEARARLLQNERLASIGGLAAGVAHEINNPLGYILLNLDGVERRLGRLETQVSTSVAAELEAVKSALSIVREGSQRVQKIVKDMLNFSRLDDALTRVDLARVLNLAIEHAALERHPFIELQREFQVSPTVLADEGRLIQVFVNLLVNAVHAIEPAEPDNPKAVGQVRVVLSTDERGWALARVQDTGRGIPAEIVGKVFDPFFTTKPQGVGLGLSLCQAIVTSFSGQVAVSSELGAGSTFTVAFPPIAPFSQENTLTWRQDTIGVEPPFGANQ
jgi:two-component system, NtrC family, sensor kinase